MLSLWRKTAELFRTYPILCVPYICADLAANCLSQISHFATRRIIIWAMTWHSVLGGSIQTYSSGVSSRAVLFASPISMGARFVNAGLYIAAMVVTAALVSMIVSGQTPRLPAAIAELRAYTKRILVYDLLFCLLTVALTASVTLPASYLSTDRFLSNPKTATTAISVVSLLTIAVSAWIMAPFAVRLLRPAGSSALSAEAKKQARYFAVLAGTATWVLSLVFVPLMVKLFSESSYSGFQWTAAQTLESLLVNLPFVLVYIAFALLANETPLDSEKPPAPSKLREYLRVLAPMHVPPPDEQ